MNTGNANILIKFLPHLAQQILALGNRLNVSGELRQNPEGVIRIPPHIARQLSQIVQTGATMGYTGFQKSLNPGHVQAFDYKIIRVQTISVSGTQYVIR